MVCAVGPDVGPVPGAAVLEPCELLHGDRVNKLFYVSACCAALLLDLEHCVGLPWICVDVRATLH